MQTSQRCKNRERETRLGWCVHAEKTEIKNTLAKMTAKTQKGYQRKKCTKEMKEKGIR